MKKNYKIETKKLESLNTDDKILLGGIDYKVIGILKRTDRTVFKLKYKDEILHFVVKHVNNKFNEI